MTQAASEVAQKREPGTIASHTTLIGILVGAGTFRMTSEASAATGPSVLLAHGVLIAAVLPTSVATAAFLSTSTSVLSMGARVAIQLTHDARRILAPSLQERLQEGKLTRLELLPIWALLGVELYTLGGGARRP